MPRISTAHIPLPADFSLAPILAFLRVREVGAIESVGHDSLVRSVRVGGRAVTVEMRQAPADDGGRSLVVRAAPGLTGKEAVGLATFMFDLDAPLGSFHAMAARDGLLRRVVRAERNLRLPRLADPFEGIVRAVLGQQVSVAAACTLAGRLARRFGVPAPTLDGRELLAFPDPQAIAAASIDDLRSLGLTGARSRTLSSVAREIADGRLDLAALASMPGDAAHARLVVLPGFGPWTASYVLLRAIGDRDAFPAADLGVIKAMERLGVARPAIQREAERWRPWRGYATLHLWASLSAGD